MGTRPPEAPSGTFHGPCRFSLSIYSPSSEPSWACSWAVLLGWTDCLAPLAPEAGGPTWGTESQAGGGGSGCNWGLEDPMGQCSGQACRNDTWWGLGADGTCVAHTHPTAERSIM